MQAAVVATIELESYLGSISTASQPTRRDPMPAVSVVSSVAENEPVSAALKQLNERLERLEVQMVSAHSDSRTHKPQADEVHGRKALTCWNCGKRGHIARRCWSRQNPNEKHQGNFNPSSARASRAREDI